MYERHDRACPVRFSIFDKNTHAPIFTVYCDLPPNHGGLHTGTFFNGIQEAKTTWTDGRPKDKKKEEDFA